MKTQSLNKPLRLSTYPQTQALRRVTLVTETYRPEVNGVANTLGHLVDGLLAKGIQVQIIRPRQHKQDLGDASAGVQSVLLPGMPIPGYGELKFGLPCAQRVRKALQAFAPDAIYVATEGPLGWVATSAASKLGVHVVSGFHTNFHQYFAHYHLSLLTPWVYRYLRYFHNRTSATLAPTRTLQQDLTEYGVRNVQVMSRGVDANRFNPMQRSAELRQKWGLKNDELAVIYVGRLAAEKNLQLAVQAYQQMRTEDHRIKFVLVGDGPLRSKLQSDHPEFIFAGMQTGDALAAHYASADIFLFPSKTDTFGNVVLEAMASGLAVVAFDYAAAHEHIEPQESGLLIPLWVNDNSDDRAQPDGANHADELFIDTAQSLIHKPNLLNRIRKGARQQAESISWSRIVDNFCQQLSQESVRHDRAKESVVI